MVISERPITVKLRDGSERTICGAHPVRPEGWRHLFCGLDPDHDGKVHIAFGTGFKSQLAAWAIEQ